MMTVPLEQQPIGNVCGRRARAFLNPKAFFNQRSQPNANGGPGPYHSIRSDDPTSRALTAWLAENRSVGPELLDGKNVEEQSVFVFCANANSNIDSFSCFQYSAVSPLRFQKILQQQQQKQQQQSKGSEVQGGNGASGGNIAANANAQWNTVLVLVAPTGSRFPDLRKDQGRLIRLDLRGPAVSKLNAIHAAKYYSHYREYVNTPSGPVPLDYATFERPFSSADCFHFSRVNKDYGNRNGKSVDAAGDNANANANANADANDDNDDRMYNIERLCTVSVDDKHRHFITEKEAGKIPVVKMHSLPPRTSTCDLDKDFEEEGIPWFRSWSTRRDRYSEKIRCLRRVGRTIKRNFRLLMTKLRR